MKLIRQISTVPLWHPMSISSMEHPKISSTVGGKSNDVTSLWIVPGPTVNNRELSTGCIVILPLLILLPFNLLAIFISKNLTPIAQIYIVSSSTTEVDWFWLSKSNLNNQENWKDIENLIYTTQWKIVNPSKPEFNGSVEPNASSNHW